jgi:tetratricopeptide (TPR) repeat protein
MKSGRRGRSAPTTTGWRVAVAAAMLAAPLLIYLVVRTAAVSLNPAAAAALPPRDPTSLVRVILPTVVDPRLRLPADLVRAARSAAVTAPLAYEPFVVQARVEQGRGRPARAIALLEEARRRRPNLILIHAQLAAYYQAAGRSRELLGEIDFILRKSPEARRALFPELAKLARDGGGRRILGEMLALNPGWRREFVAYLETRPPNPDQAASLVAAIRTANPSANVAPERRVYMHALMAAGDYRRARAIWLETLSPAARQAHDLLVDGAFRNPAIGAPFGWTFHDTANGRAGPTASGNAAYLDVSYFGGANVVLAEQILALPPGRYRLSARARSISTISSGEIFWMVRCLPAQSDIGNLRLDGLTGEDRLLRATFTVPASCAGQRLSLEARPGDLAASVDAQISALEVAREN